jgi:small subunit ribosomal protein S17
MSTITTQQPIKKSSKLKGKVVSIAMEKTVVVEVETLKTHPKYLKKYLSTKRYKVHAPEKKHAIGDVVWFQACRPMSRDKRHELVEAE